MKKITPAALEAVFAGGGTEVSVPEEIAQKARIALERMLELGA